MSVNAACSIVIAAVITRLIRMILDRNLIFATLLVGLAACSSHVPNGSVMPQTMERSRALAVNPATSCVVVPSSVGTGFGSFGKGVSGVSATDAWAVGSNDFTFHHFDGRAWHSVPAPAIPNQSSYQEIFVNDVTPITSNDVWVDGQGVGFTNPGTNRIAFFLHWNGSAWSYVPSDPALTNEFGIVALAGDASNNVWAIGQSTVNNSSIQLERWNGTKWSLVASQGFVLGILDAGEGLAVFSPTDV